MKNPMPDFPSTYSAATMTNTDAPAQLPGGVLWLVTKEQDEMVQQRLTKRGDHRGAQCLSRNHPRDLGPYGRGQRRDRQLIYGCP
jgi:hypothetical protein